MMKGHWPYAFIINQQSLLFYFRDSCFRPPFSQSKQKIRELFPNVTERKSGELKVHLCDRRGAELVEELIRSQPKCAAET
jgi:hypothetical protein